MSKAVAILGSTGSIGRQTVEVIRRHREQFSVCALAAGHNVDELANQIRMLKPSLVSVATERAAEELREQVGNSVEIVVGDQGLIDVATHPDADMVLTAVVGTRGLAPTIAAIQAGKTIALANKETLVAAGHVVTKLAAEKNVPILPVDSEHSAIFQCLQGERIPTVRRIILTASGGPFREHTLEEMEHVSVADALRHPNWSMGAKITLDSATLMNKGLEVIEAHWLFGLPYEQVDVMIHPQSIIHSLVEFVDSAQIAQLGMPDMKVPIQFALTYPERVAAEWPRLDLTKIAQLTFSQPDLHRFPCLRLAYEAGKTGGSMPAVLNAANEAAGSLFLNGTIGFLDIASLIARVMENHSVVADPDLETIVALDSWARAEVLRIAKQYSA
ncbi:1-deoxy-D-xylulose 5-phosphate reductoisomerase 1 [Collibacillus ludicampi]|uniref:1-deoxy-D-xylulose 5-phosphate reductoisomerase n=1 Tax=Collibacillus ludicampi TaxID=2771369 RepID=A0AAV4LJ23_9BACL|nr:1-deoxy-D-xylulose-5-phosphate reductoisomerase [Collibacillus ludicampi]GIM47834.1 1-deoxy-D-xylulose 5-phosphate reductoisomerase 1 [Collibacillus ludicampi]